MSNTARSRPGSALFWIDRECDQFEKDWREGNKPRIEEVISRLPADGQSIAFRELLAIELELRRQAGEEIRRDDFARRFPTFAGIVNELLDSLVSSLDATQPINPNDTNPNSATTCTRYHDLRIFRRGGLGTLYRAIDESLHRETVVKFMNDQCEKDPSLLAQFKVEAEVTSRLDHPGIVPVYGIGQDWHGRPFYVMRLINGRELKQAIQEYHRGDEPKRRGHNSRQSLFTLLEHLTSACNTVAYAHHVGVVHCDLKPANIMIGKYGETFVLDWGLATNFERTSTFFSPNEPTMRPHVAGSGSTSGQRGGTYGYISPEQLLTDGPIGPTSDVYSLGATLYEILTGQAPFNGRDPDVREQIQRGEFPPPRRLQPGVCPKLEAICLQAMHLSPLSRYATAKLLANDLTNWMHDEEIQAAPDRWFDRLTRFGRRHRGLTAAFFVTLLTFVVAAGWTDRTVKMAAHEKALREKSEQLREVEERTFQAEKEGFTIALDAFEGLCRPFANGEMNNLGVFQPFVDEIKKFTALYLESFESTSSMQLHTARVYELRAVVSGIIGGNSAAAIKDLQQAQSLYTKSLPTAAEKFDRDLRLAQNRLSQGRLLIQLKQLDEAQRVVQSARDNLQRLRKLQADNHQVLRDLAEAYHCLGEVYLNTHLDGAAREQALLNAETNFNHSKDLREQLVKATSGEESRNHIRDMARSLGYLGDLYLAQGNIPLAVQAFEDSKQRRAALYRSKSGDPEHRFQFARGLANFGRLERGYGGHLAAATEDLVKAADLQQDLIDDFLGVTNFSADFGETQNLLAEVYLFTALDEPARAADLHKQARQAAEKASDVFGRLDQQRNSSGPSGLAQSYVLLSILNRSSSPADSRRHAQDAENRLNSLAPQELLSGSDLVTLAMAKSLQNQPDAALRALNMAITRGENTAYRFECHKKLGFQAVASEERLAPQFKALLKDVREKLTVE